MNATDTIDKQRVEAKLPHEREHYEALQRMRTLESYYRWTFDLVRPYIGRRALDAGCGVGNFTQFLAEAADHVVGVDLSPENIEAARQRFADFSHVQIMQADLEASDGTLAGHDFDTVSCLDVMEHVEDDVGLLENLRRVVAPGGHLIIKVPACPWLYGSIDIASDHYRRYTRDDLRLKAGRAGWTVVRTQYMNIAGVLPYWLKSRVLRREANFSRTFSPRQLRQIRRIVPVLRGIDRITGPLVGQSALLIARNDAVSA